MATIAPAVSNLNVGGGDGSVCKVTWTPVTEADTCGPVDLTAFADKSIQVTGTFGGASVALQGSNDAGTNFLPLNDATGTVIAITTAKIKEVLEMTEQVKPVATGGTGQSLTVVILARRATPMRT